MTSFDRITFLACTESNLVDQTLKMIMECYPGSGNVYPKLQWNFSLPVSKTFSRQTLILRSPTQISDNPSNLSVEQLLSQTRYLAFFFYAGPLTTGKRLTIYIDDIDFRMGALTAARDWSLFE